MAIMFRYIRDHWPEFLFVLLMIIGGALPLLLSAALWIRIALIPIGWLAAFGVFAALIYFDCRFRPPPSEPPTR
jgi:hypothetical protein